MSPLYEIAERYRAALAELTASGAPPELIADTLESIQGEAVERGLAVQAQLLNLAAEAEAVREAERRMRERRQALEAAHARLTAYQIQHLRAVGVTQLTCPEFTARLRASPARVVIDPAADLPEEFVIRERVGRPDRGAIHAALDAGQTIPGCRLERGHHLEVR